MNNTRHLTRRITRRGTTRTSTSLNKVEVEKNQPKQEQFNLNAIIIKNLSNENPSKGKTNVYYSYIENQYKQVEDTENYLEILDINESILHKEDTQAVTQEEYHARKKKLKAQIRKEGEDIGELEIDSFKSMRNRLYYCERGSETLQKKIINRECETVKLNRVNHNGIFHQWDRFDTYMSNFLKEKDKKRMEDEFKMKGKITQRKKVETFSDSLNRPSLFKALKLLERQIMQIKNRDKYLFYREWNKFDDSQESSKMIYMLLSFPQNARIKNRSVTALCWNTKFEDLFAVGYGSYDFPSKKEEKLDNDNYNNNNDDQNDNGYIYVFSIKNNFFPEVKYTTDSGVLCLDFHPKEFYYLVAGFYDGTVGVFDISQKVKNPIIFCDIRYQKHLDPVWQVKWYTPFNEPGEYVFYSISSDGRVIKWTFFKNKTSLETEEVIKLKYSDVLQQELQNKENNNSNDLTNTNNININETDTSREKQDEALAFGNAGGMCFDFNNHKNFEHYFIIGTEEGKIYLCSTAHREKTIFNYEGHTMGVYSLSWNPFQPKLFASCSADWTIKVWHYKTFSPLIVYDMQSAIGDLSWSPWCSTIFATVNVSGEIKFFDLNRARKAPLEPKKYKETAINHIAFNKNEFVFITGNDKGKVHLWKMAEPLRVTVDKKELEEKEKEKKAAEANKNSLPTTKIVIPPNLRDDMVKQRKTYIQKKQIMADLNPEVEKKRIDEFLELLDITDV